MNRFRARKKSIGEASRDVSRQTSRQTSRRPSIDSDVPAMPSFSRTFRRKKQPAPEPKPEIDLNAALPPSDDFRTSLLMPNLCARFSMLKEQDDPNSLLGKANDDSVLFPKRASRLDLFNNRQALNDIAESESLQGSVRPPFATMRMGSYGSEGHSVDDGSIMGRSKPGEGNTMFGGRQKLYKIPVGGAGSTKNFGGQDESEPIAGATMGGKPVYEMDTSLSTFQKLRQKEKEERDQAALEFGIMRSSREQDRSGSPPFPRYNRNRETSSSTASAAPSQSRASTAATSVASQKSVYAPNDMIHGPHAPSHTAQIPTANNDKAFIRSRRLYGQVGDHDLQERQQPLQRMNSFTRSRTPTTGMAANPLRQSRSATSLRDPFPRPGPSYTPPTFRAESPVTQSASPRMGEFDLGFGEDARAQNMVDSGYGRSPPLSPSLSPELKPHSPDPTLAASLEPNDMGKATASGAFNKPKKQYDEHQYLQRQLQLQQERNTPSPQFSRPFSPAMSSLHDNTPAGRSRNNSQGSNFSRNNSVRRPWMEDRVPRAVPESGRSMTPQLPGEESVRPSMERSFFSANSLNSGHTSPVSKEEHPINHLPLDSPNLPDETDEDEAFGERLLHTNDPSRLADGIDDVSPDTRSFHSEKTVTQAQSVRSVGDTADPLIGTDSPTLGPVGASNDLSGLVKAHLRSDSGQSSIYPDDPQRRSRKIEVRDSIFGHGSALSNQALTNSDADTSESYQDSSAPPPLTLNARNILEQAKLLNGINSNTHGESNKPRKLYGNGKAQRVLGGDAPCDEQTLNAMGIEPKSSHNRGASIETQQERQELATELAERRRLLTDKLQNFVEAESRSASPAPSVRHRDDTPAKASNGFGLLKKSSRGSLAGKEKNSKAMKMLGIEQEAATNPPPALYLMRDQYSDRSNAPRARFPKDAPQDKDSLPHFSEDSRQSPNRSGRGHVSRASQSSKSSSAYSGNSEREPSFPSQSDGRHSQNDGQSSGRSNEARHAPNQANGRTTPGHGSTRPSEEIVQPPYSAPSGRSRGNSRASPFEPGQRRVPPAGTPFMMNPASKSGPPNFSRSAPTSRDNHPSQATGQPGTSHPMHSPTRTVARSHQNRKFSINKQDISEPRFICSTSSVDTVNLPPGASLKNGMDSPPSPVTAPPIPARDSRRKRTMTLRQAFGKGDRSEPSSALPSPVHNGPPYDDLREERSTFSDDEPSQRSKQRLKKISREDRIASAKMRHAAAQSRGPVSPTTEHMPLQARAGMQAATSPMF